NVSYTLQAGRSIGLPNYPPHVIGGSKAVNDYLFVGVRAGAEPTDKNRFLIPSGLEIFDVSIWENPIRLSQVRTDAPVLGVEVVGNSAFLAASQKGLMLVDVTNPKTPLVLAEMPVPGHIATDVAYDSLKNILAMSVADDLGTGFIRFFDLGDDELGP